MASLKEIRKRIASVRNTQKITRAMKMVAASKLRRSQQALMNARPYAQHMAKLVGHLAALESDHPCHPLLCSPEEKTGRVLLVILTSDRGFCGGFNGNLLRSVWEWSNERRSEAQRVSFHVVGRKGRDFFKSRGIETEDCETGVYENFTMGHARQRADRLIADYKSGAFDECYIVYNRFKSAISQEITFQKVVPISPDISDAFAIAEQRHVKKPMLPTSFSREMEVSFDEKEFIADYIYEPPAPILLEELLPRYLTTDILRIFLDSITSEFGARMVAMDSATNNCSEMIDKLTLTGNRLRQAAITNELMDIVNGAEALK